MGKKCFIVYIKNKNIRKRLIGIASTEEIAKHLFDKEQEVAWFCGQEYLEMIIEETKFYDYFI